MSTARRQKPARKKNKLDEIMATGVETGSALEECAHGEALVSSARDAKHVTIKHPATSQSWSLPYILVAQACARITSSDEVFTLGIHSSAVFELFIQWLYTRTYQEKEGQVKAFDLHGVTRDNVVLDIVTSCNETLHWTVKAAILSWHLGACLGSRKFQNHAMRCLFRALSRPHTTPVTGSLLEYVLAGGKKSIFYRASQSQLCALVADLVVRNWGDSKIVDAEDQDKWSTLLGSSSIFRDKFVKGTLQTIEKRREKPLLLEDYLIPEENFEEIDDEA